MSAEALVEAIERLARDEEVVNRHFGRSVRQPWPGHDMGFTLRESEVALFLTQGLRNRDIASALWVSENTVKTHLKSIFQKTAVTSRAEAIVRISRDASFSAKRNDERNTVARTKRSVKVTQSNG
jgi:DNA-binding NarL/FixJ family response regulator